MKKQKSTLMGPYSPKISDPLTHSNSRSEDSSSNNWQNAGEDQPTRRFSYATIHKMRAACRAPRHEKPQGPTNPPVPQNRQISHATKETGSYQNPLVDKHYDEGLAYWQKEMPEKAIVCFNKTLAKGRKQANCHLMMALCYIEKDNYSEAIEHLKGGLEVKGITPKETVALNYRITQCYKHLERVKDGIAQNSQTVEPDPQSSNISEARHKGTPKKGDIEKKPAPHRVVTQSARRTDPPVIYDNDEVSSSPLKIWISVLALGVAFFLTLSHFDDLSSQVKNIVTTRPGMESNEQNPQRVRAPQQSHAGNKNELFQKEQATVSLETPFQGTPVTKENRHPASPSDQTNTLKKLEYDSSLAVSTKSRNRTVARGKPVYIISGTVTNSGLTGKSAIIVEGKIFDEEGNLLAAARAPCGRIQRYNVIQKTDPADMDTLYEKDGKTYNCSIGKGGYTKYQLIFSRIPSDLLQAPQIITRAGTLPAS